MVLTRSEWCMFDRCYSGLLKSDFEGKKARFLSLTTAPHVVSVNVQSDSEKLKLIKVNFDTLRKRYEKDFGKSFGSFFRVSTLEGYGVLHVLFVGSNIPHSWLVENWNEIHGSHIVDIRYPRGSGYDGAMYVVGQYVAGQKGKKIFGYSRDWVYSGFTKDLKECRDICKKWDDPRVNQFGLTWFPVDYGKYKKTWSLFLEKRLNNEVYDVWEVTDFHAKNYT